MASTRRIWTDKARKMLVGRKIVRVNYMTEDEREETGWNHCPVVITLDNGVVLFPSADDEGNEAGALFTSGAEPVLPVI